MDEQSGERGAEPEEEPGIQPTRRRARERAGLRRVLSDVEAFGAAVLGMPLWPYQAEVARSVLASMTEGRGESLTVLMPRQSGKNQLSAHLEAYLLTRCQRRGGSRPRCWSRSRDFSACSTTR
jgi:hypothetical protein